MSDLHSVKAPEAPETKTRTFRVLKRDESIDAGGTRWDEVGTYSTPYTATADEVGEQFGEGDYLLIERESDYSFNTVYPMRVVAEKRFRLADDETA